MSKTIIPFTLSVIIDNRMLSMSRECPAFCPRSSPWSSRQAEDGAPLWATPSQVFTHLYVSLLKALQVRDTRGRGRVRLTRSWTTFISDYWQSLSRLHSPPLLHTDWNLPPPPSSFLGPLFQHLGLSSEVCNRCNVSAEISKWWRGLDLEKALERRIGAQALKRDPPPTTTTTTPYQPPGFLKGGGKQKKNQ